VENGVFKTRPCTLLDKNTKWSIWPYLVENVEHINHIGIIVLF